MDEYWICQNCHSLNRLGQGRCYSCHEKYGSEPKAPEPIRRDAGAVVTTPPLLGGFGAPRPAEPPAYISRPVSAAPPGSPSEAGSFTEAYRAAALVSAKQGRARRPSPLAPLGRRFGQALAARQSVSVSWLGYLTAGLLTLLLVVGVLLVGTVLPAAMDALKTGSVSGAWSALDAGRQMSVQVLAIACAGLALLCLMCFSLFVGLSTHNAPGLGAQLPLLSPYRAGVCWFGVLWAQFKIALGLVVPGVLFWLGYPLPAAIAAVLFLELGQRHLDDPFGWLNGPSQHLPDLYRKLALRGSGGSLMAGAWSACFRAANAFFIIACALPLIGLGIAAASDLAGRPEIRGWQASGLGPAQLGIALVAGSLVGFLAGAIGLLVPITIELVERQRTRKTAMRLGRGSPWAGQGQAGRPSPYDPYARELPQRQSGYDPFRRGQPRSPATYDPYGPAEDEDQASLYSPSTTPSSPWSDRSEGPPF